MSQFIRKKMERNVKKSLCLVVVFLMTNWLMPLNIFASSNPDVMYCTHVQNVGWQDPVKNGEMSGTSGQGLRLEGIEIKLNANGYDLGVTYQTHIQNIGWEADVGRGWKSNGDTSGTSGQSLRLEGIQINLTGSDADQFDIYYRVHAQNVGWLNWAKNGESAGTQGFGYRLEGIYIEILPKGAAAPGDTAVPFIGAYSLIESQVLGLVNQVRAQNNLNYVTSTPELHWVAQVRAKEISETFSHTRPDQRDCFSLLEDANITYVTAGENIAGGYPNPWEVVNGWMNSEDHRQNILDPDYTKLGCGYYYTNSDYGDYWSQMFISE
jgi:hypothetical protein